MTTETNGTNGHKIPVTTALELHTKVAQYRTALVALMAHVRRAGGYMSPQDQQLMRQIQDLLDERPPQ